MTNFKTFSIWNELPVQLQKVDEELMDLKTLCASALGKARENEYLPLWMHLADTAAVMYFLMTEKLSQGLMDSLISDVDGDSAEDKRKKVIDSALFLALVHDSGKESALFQSRVEAGIHRDAEGKHQIGSKLDRSHSSYIASHPETYHAVCGAIQLRKMEFDSPGGKIKIPKGLASVVAAHHGKIFQEEGQRETAATCDYSKVVFGENPEKWIERMRDICRTALKSTGGLQTNWLPYYSEPALMILCALLIEADWLASDEDHFPLIKREEQDTVGAYPERWKKGILSIGFTKPPVFTEEKLTEDGFKEMFSFSPYLWQKEVILTASDISRPGIVVLEAPTGGGKTEAALAVASVFNAKAHRSGLYLGLPSQASANGLFGRFAKWADGQAGDGECTLRLAHGKARFNTDYQSLKLKAVNKNVDLDGDQNSHLLVNEWMERPKTSLLADFVIGTVDQGLMGILNIKHMMLRLLGLAEKAIVIDEVHAYDAYMQSSLRLLLNWLGRYRTPVILVSATLPNQFRKTLIEGYLEGLECSPAKQKEFEREIAQTAGRYPSLTWTDGESVHQKTLSWSEKMREVQITQVRYKDDQQEYEKVAENLRKNLSDGGCGAVIFNTVKKVQEFGKYLMDIKSDFETILIHSRFTDADRSGIEKILEQRCGKAAAPEDRNRVLVVGTQIIEQSLDVDFDYLVSEIAPIDLLIQRAGRLHRHSNRTRPEKLKEPNLAVAIPENSGEAANYRQNVYSEWILFQTEKVLGQKFGIPDDVPALIHEVYDSDGQNVAEESIRNKWEKWETDLASKNNHASASQLKEPPDHLSRKGCSLGNVIGGSTKTYGSARDIEPTVTAVILIQKKESWYQVGSDSQNILQSTMPLNDQNSEKIREGMVQIRDSLWKDYEAEVQKKGNDPFVLWKNDKIWEYSKFLVIDQNTSFEYDSKFGLRKRRNECGTDN